jgi:Zn-dependent protease/predicted transcriptional regulator
MGGIRIGKILGFEINVDWSWLLIFFLVVYSLASGYFPTMYPNFGIAMNWLVGILAAALLFVSVLIHELSHSMVARSYGTPVRGITLFMFGGVSQTAEEPKSAREEFWMAIVGPVTSFGLAAVFYALGGIGAVMVWPSPVVAVLGYLAMINLLLAVFNLAPGFPLDGGRVLRSALWAATGDLTRSTRYASYAGQAFGYILMGLGFTNVLGGSLIGGLWLVFIGWFLAGAARSSYQQLLVKQALSGVTVSQVMTSDVPVVDADTSLRQFVDETLLRYDYSCYPVHRGEELIGIVGIEEVRRFSPEQWQNVSVGEVAHEIDTAYKVAESDDAYEALTKLATEEVCRLMVMDNGQLKGTVGRESVFRLVQTKMLLGL